MEYKLPDYTPQETKEFLVPAVSYIHSVLKDNSIGIYLHGSLAMGSFQLGLSDIDLIFVVKEHLSSKEKNEVINYLNKARLQGKSIDISILLEDKLQDPQWPIVVELYYDPYNVFENEPDMDVIAFLYETKERGFCIWGKPISKVFSKIPAKHHLLSIILDFQYNVRKGPLEKPAYMVLNACRTMAFIKEAQVLSKLEGGKWGIKNLPERYRNLVNKALSCYQGKADKDQISWDNKELGDFAQYITSEIENIIKIN